MQNVEIIDYDHQGRGIGKIDNKTIFIDNALPGETVNIEIKKEKKNFAEAKVLSYIKSSTNRVEPKCPNFSICGGCDIMHMSYEEQLKFKYNKITNIMNRYCNFNFDIKPIIESSNLEYRNKVTFHVKNNKIGYFEEKSNNLISIDKCFLLDKNIDNIYQVIKKYANLNGIESITIRASRNISDNMVIIYTNKNVDRNYWISLLKEYVNNIIIFYNKFETIYGSDYMYERIFDYNFIITKDSFFQVNTLQTEKLYSKALEYADIKDNDTVLDLYCGTGTIGILASKYAKEVIGIELNKEAIKSANKNKEINDIKNITFYAGDTGTILHEHNYHVDIVIVDPPRAGLDDLAINELFKINPKKIVYVSCDPMTLARDLNKLSERYIVNELTPVDMFPNTKHVECVCVFNRR